MKKVLISGYIGFNNFGDEAIFYTLCTHLKMLNCTVEALSASNIYDIQTYPYKNPIKIIKAILNCDVLISGGGSLLQNKTSNFSLIYYLFIILIAKLFFKKVIIFAQGIEKINGKFYEFITKNVLKICDFISVRDLNSQKLLENWKINSTLLSDPVYSLIQNIEINNNKQGLIVQLRDIKGLKKDFLEKLAKIISKYYKKEITVLALQKEYDEKICLEFVNELKKININSNYVYFKNVNEIINLINNAKYVISTRLHGLICATGLNSEVFAFSYDDKINTIINEFNLQNINLYNYSYDELDEKMKNFFNNEKYNKSYRHQYRKFNWDFIDEILKK